jgi:hypothetical protein
MLLQVDGFVRGFLGILHSNDIVFFCDSDARGAGLSNGAEIFIIGGVLRAPHSLLRQFDFFKKKKRRVQKKKKKKKFFYLALKNLKKPPQTDKKNKKKKKKKKNVCMPLKNPQTLKKKKHQNYLRKHFKTTNNPVDILINPLIYL